MLAHDPEYRRIVTVALQDPKTAADLAITSLPPIGSELRWTLQDIINVARKTGRHTDAAALRTSFKDILDGESGGITDLKGMKGQLAERIIFVRLLTEDFLGAAVAAYDAYKGEELAIKLDDIVSAALDEHPDAEVTRRRIELAAEIALGTYFHEVSPGTRSIVQGYLAGSDAETDPAIEVIVIEDADIEETTEEGPPGPDQVFIDPFDGPPTDHDITVVPVAE